MNIDKIRKLKFEIRNTLLPLHWNKLMIEFRLPRFTRNDEYRTLNIEYRITNNEHRTTNNEHRTTNNEHRTTNN